MSTVAKTTLGTLKINRQTYTVERITNGVEWNVSLLGPRGGEYYLTLFEDNLWAVRRWSTGAPLRDPSGREVHLRLDSNTDVTKMKVKYL